MTHFFHSPFASYSPTSETCYGGAEIQLAANLEAAYRAENWPKILELFQRGPILTHIRDSVLMKGIDHLEEVECLTLIRAAHKHNTLSPQTDSEILKIAVRQGFTDLVWEQLQKGKIDSSSAEASLREAVKKNEREIMHLLLENCAICQEEKNKAALAAVKHNSFDCLIELLMRKAVSGIYNHPTNSPMGELLCDEQQECIWTALLRKAGRKGYLEMAQAIGIAVPRELTKEDLGYLAIAATMKRNKNALQEFLNHGPIERCLRDEAIDHAKEKEYNELIPILYSARLF